MEQASTILSARGLRPWQVIVLFGLAQAALTGFGTFFDVLTGVGMFFVYAVSYFNALVVVLPILRLRRFGVGAAIYLPWAIVGLPMEYYMEYVRTPVLRSAWGAVGWCIFGLATGLSADLAYYFLPGRWTERRRAIATGLVLGLVNFGLVTAAVSFFYTPPAFIVGRPPFLNDPSFTSIAPWALPWMLLCSAFGGYTAYAINREWAGARET